MPQDPSSKKPWEYLLDPMISEETIAPAQDYIDSPSLDRSPWQARVAGFGAGALEGLRQQITPAQALLSAIPGGAALRGLGRGAKVATQGLRKAAPTLDLIEDIPTQQIAPSMDDVGALIGDMNRNLARIPPKKPLMGPSIGELLPEATPVGGEYMYNLGRQAPQIGREFNPLEALGPRFGGKAR